jgi:putative ABC transport system permease protein
LTLAGALGAIGLATPILLLALRSRARWFERMLPGIGHLVGTWLSARPLGASFAIVSIAAIVAAGSGVLLTVHSISQSFVSTAETRFPDALLVSVGSMFDMSEREPLLRETVAEIARVPGVIDLDEQYGRGRTLLFRGEEVGIFAQRMSTAARRATLPVLSGRADEVALRIARGAVGISDGFARHFGVEVGDAIELATSRGLRRFAVGGVIRDHQGPAGSLFFDLDVFDAWWPREGVWTLVLWTDGAPESLIDAIRRSVDTDQALFFAHGSALRELYRDWIGQFVDLLYVVVGVSAALGGLALTTQLVGIVAERGRELALLRAAGASPGQLSASILVEGLIVALLGAGMGLPAGIALSRPLSDYVVESYGWSLRPAVEVPELALMLAATLLIAAAPALYPAVRARHPLEASLLQPEG